MDIAGAADILGMIGFGVGVTLLALAPSSSESVFNSWTKGFMISAFAVYLAILAIDVFSHFIVNEQVEMLEGYIEMLFPVLAILAVFAAHGQQQLLDLRGTQRALSRSYDMMLAIVDQAASGFIVLDDMGRITFANKAAKDVLDLAENPDTGAITTPGWSVCETGREPGDLQPDFSAHLEDLLARSVPLTIEWPNGWRVELKASGSALADAAGQVGGTLATFERPFTR